MSEPVAPRRERRIFALTVGLGPIWLLVYFWLAAPAFLKPLWHADVAVGGVPLGWVIVIAAAWLSIGAAAVIDRTQGSRALAFALLLLVFPALFLVLLGPAFVLIAENLGPG